MLLVALRGPPQRARIQFARIPQRPNDLRPCVVFMPRTRGSMDSLRGFEIRRSTTLNASGRGQTRLDTSCSCCPANTKKGDISRPLCNPWAAQLWRSPRVTPERGTTPVRIQKGASPRQGLGRYTGGTRSRHIEGVLRPRPEESSGSRATEAWRPVDGASLQIGTWRMQVGHAETIATTNPDKKCTGNRFALHPYPHLQHEATRLTTPSRRRGRSARGRLLAAEVPVQGMAF